jgi:hypothetical protein
MKTFRYYLVDELPSQVDGVEVYTYAEVGDKKLIAVAGEIEVNGEEMQYADIKELLELSHANQELNRLIVNDIRSKYSLDDELALLNKQGTEEYLSYREYCESVISEYKKIKINAGLK